LLPAQPPAWEVKWLPVLAAPGRWSLSYYMLHQPVMLGVLMAWKSWST
jgi:peptidoglycan/LPS O-acetylase OafA/YrhL